MSSYLDSVAAEIRTELPREAVPREGADALFLIYAVLLLAKATDVTPEDVHNAWAAWMASRGESHPSMVPFSELSAEAQAEDSKFVDAIRRVAKRRQDAGAA